MPLSLSLGTDSWVTWNYGISMTITGLTADPGNTIEVTRSWSSDFDSGSDVIRAAQKQQVTGTTMFFQDYEAPFYTTITYTAIERDSSGAIIDSGQDSTVVNYLGNQVWLSDPLAPETAVPVTLELAALTQLSYVRDGDLPQPLGASLPVAVVGTRRGLSGVPFDVLCSSRSEFAAVRSLLTTVDPVCVRVPEGDLWDFLPPVMYVSSSQVSVIPLTRNKGIKSMKLAWTFDRVRASTIPVVNSSWTYDGLEALFATYADLPLHYSTYLDMQRGL